MEQKHGYRISSNKIRQLSNMIESASRTGFPLIGNHVHSEYQETYKTNAKVSKRVKQKQLEDIYSQRSPRLAADANGSALS